MNKLLWSIDVGGKGDLRCKFQSLRFKKWYSLVDDNICVYIFKLEIKSNRVEKVNLDIGWIINMNI